MSNYRMSGYTLKSLGLSEMEISLVLRRNSEYGEKFISTSDSRVMQGQRYNGLSSSDTAHAENFNNEFGHLVNPTLRKRIR